MTDTPFRLPRREDLDTAARELATFAKDALYITVGAGVLAAQKLNVQRLEFAKKLQTPLDEGKERVDHAGKGLDGQVKAIESRLTAMEERIEALLDQVQSALPEPARDVVQHARDAARTARGQVRSLFGVTDSAPSGDDTADTDAGDSRAEAPAA